MEDGKKADEFEAALSGKGCDKAVELISFCDAFSIPLLTLTNVNGYKAKMCSGKTDRQKQQPLNLRLCRTLLFQR